MECGQWLSFTSDNSSLTLNFISWTDTNLPHCKWCYSITKCPQNGRAQYLNLPVLWSLILHFIRVDHLHSASPVMIPMLPNLSMFGIWAKYPSIFALQVTCNSSGDRNRSYFLFFMRHPLLFELSKKIIVDFIALILSHCYIVICQWILTQRIISHTKIICGWLLHLHLFWIYF